MLLNTFTLINHFAPTGISARCPFRGGLGPLGSRAAASRWGRTWEALVPRLGTRSRHQKKTNTGAPAPTTEEVKFFEKTKVSPGSEFSLHFIKTALPSRLKGAPNELAASAEVLLGVAFPCFSPSSSLPASPSPRGKDKPEAAAKQPPTPRADAAAPRPTASRGISPPEAEGYPSAG